MSGGWDTERSVNHPRVIESEGGGVCPEQHWGTLDDGTVFYFRLRHGQARLHVGPPGTPMEEMPLTNPEFSWVEFDAAWERGEADQYPHRLFRDPIGFVDVYEEDWGWFETDEERVSTFGECLQQIDEYQKENSGHEL